VDVQENKLGRITPTPVWGSSVVALHGLCHRFPAAGQYRWELRALHLLQLSVYSRTVALQPKRKTDTAPTFCALSLKARNCFMEASRAQLQSTPFSLRGNQAVASRAD